MTLDRYELMRSVSRVIDQFNISLLLFDLNYLLLIYHRLECYLCRVLGYFIYLGRINCQCHLNLFGAYSSPLKSGRCRSKWTKKN